jgi:hypothetical protein
MLRSFFDFVGSNPAAAVCGRFLLRNGETESARLRAVEWLGRSGSRGAVEPLLRAVDDPSPAVRKRAVSSLGRIRARAAAPALLAELRDPESDVRCEAAEALGRIGGESVVSALFAALDERDTKIRNAAAGALGEIGGSEVLTRLLERFNRSDDDAEFPALADALSRLGAREIVEPVMRRLAAYESTVFRLQLLNAVCRVLGAGNAFYRIVSKHDYARVDEVNRLIRGARRDVRRTPLFRGELAASIVRTLAVIAESYRTEDHRAFLRAVWEFMASIQLITPEMALVPGNGFSGVPEHPDLLRPSIEAVNRFLILKEREDIRDEGMVFLVICIGCLLSVMRGAASPSGAAAPLSGK